MNNKTIFMICALLVSIINYRVMMGARESIINNGDIRFGVKKNELMNIGRGNTSNSRTIRLESADSYFGTESGNTSESEVGYISEDSGSDDDNELLSPRGRLDAAKKAILWNRDQELKFLLEHGDLAQFDKEEALRNAAAYGYHDVLKVLLDAGALVNAQDMEGATALMYAAGAKQSKDNAFGGNIIAVVEELLARGASFDAVNKQYNNIDIQDMYGDTALIKAVQADNPEVVHILILAGADSALENNAGESALSLANPDMAQVLANAEQEKQVFELAPLLSSKIADELHLLPKDLAHMVAKAASNPYGAESIALKAALFVQKKLDEDDAIAQRKEIKNLSLDDAFVSEEGIKEVLD